MRLLDHRARYARADRSVSKIEMDSQSYFRLSACVHWRMDTEAFRRAFQRGSVYEDAFGGTVTNGPEDPEFSFAAGIRGDVESLRNCLTVI